MGLGVKIRSDLGKAKNGQKTLRRNFKKISNLFLYIFKKVYIWTIPRRIQTLSTMKTTEKFALSVTPKSPDSRWVALDIDNKIISEGKTPEEANTKAKEISEFYLLSHVPKKGVTYIF